MLKLRAVTNHDETFLYEVYVSTRRDELMMTGWGPSEQDAFLRMQYGMQKSSYAMRWPDADHQAVLLDGVPIGRMMTAVTEGAVVLIDVSLLDEYRGQGIGTQLLRGLQTQAAASGRAVTLHVLENNPARELYRRLGFRETGEQFPYVAMEWRVSESGEELYDE